MKKLVFALAAIPAAAAVHAQSNVTIYGLVDTGIEYANHTGTGDNSVLRLTSGGQNTSRFGFKGVEDLGSGLKATFQLEGGFFADTGAQDGNLFKRQANVGLQGAFGSFVAGKSFTTVYDFILPYDPMGYAPNYSWATSGNGSQSTSKYGMTTAFDNLIKYQYQIGGFKVGASYGFGEQAGSTSDAAKYALGLNYAVGPVGVAGTVERVNGTTTVTGARDKAIVYHLAGAYQISSAVAVKVGYRNYKKELATGAADQRADTFWGGVNYNITPALELTGAIYHQNIKNVASGTDADPTMYVLRAKYALSKRTFLYGATAYAKAKNGQVVSLSRDSAADGGVAGVTDSQTGLTVGIQHRF